MSLTVMTHEWTHQKTKGKAHGTFIINATIMEKLLQIGNRSIQRLRRATRGGYQPKKTEPNSFVSMHLKAVKRLRITDCWIVHTLTLPQERMLINIFPSCSTQRLQ